MGAKGFARQKLSLLTPTDFISILGGTNNKTGRLPLLLWQDRETLRCAL